LADDCGAMAGMNTTIPSIARMYDYYLGGKDNFAVDRQRAEEVLRRVPDAGEGCRANRRFLGRAVRHVAQAGVRQFLDLGTGLPSQNNVHEIAQRVNSEARVVYVDNDPIVLVHARALLAADDSTAVIQEDMRDPAKILDHPDTQRLIDFSQPVAIMFVAMLHFLTDHEDPWAVVSAFAERMAPGSYLVLSHGTLENRAPEHVAAIQEEYQQATAPLVFRDRDAITRFYEGFELVDPGLVRLTDWRPDHQGERTRPGGQWMLAGVGRKL
jgi:O-methyltransferase involved in polyketide biosynthesis